MARATNRPATVLIAVILLNVVGALTLVSGIIEMNSYDKHQVEMAFFDVFHRYHNLPADLGAAEPTPVPAIINLLLGLVVLFVVAPWVLQGDRRGRVLVWWSGGISVCRLGYIWLSGWNRMMAYNDMRRDDSSLPSYEDLQQALAHQMSIRFFPIMMIMSVTALTLIVMVVISLALPRSNLFFDRRPMPRIRDAGQSGP